MASVKIVFTFCMNLIISKILLHFFFFFFEK